MRHPTPEAPEGGECPADEAWSALVEGALPHDEAENILRHADGCERCHLLALAVDAPVAARSAVEEAHAVERIGRYRVLGPIGGGGMGVVYEAHDPDLDRRVAIKVLRTTAASPASRDDLTRRLQREARALARVSHPNVVGVHDVGEHAGSPYIAMELIAGRTLAAYLHDERPGVREIARIFRDVAAGLHAAHARGLVHRDLKPHNILVSRDGTAKITDFGLARRGGQRIGEAAERDELRSSPSLDAASLTVTGQMMGTPAYMAPEQFRGAATDARTDVFAFGITLHEAVHGGRPFEGSTFVALRAAVLSGKRSGSRRPGVPRALDALLDRCLATDPAARPPALDGVAQTLDQIRLSDASGKRRSPRRLHAGAAAVVLLLAVAAASRVLGVGADPPGTSDPVAANRARGASLIASRTANDPNAGTPVGEVFAVGNATYAQRVIPATWYGHQDPTLDHAWVVANFGLGKAFLVRNGFLRMYEGLWDWGDVVHERVAEDIGPPLEDEYKDARHVAIQRFGRGYFLWDGDGRGRLRRVSDVLESSVGGSPGVTFATRAADFTVFLTGYRAEITCGSLARRCGVAIVDPSMDGAFVVRDAFFERYSATDPATQRPVYEALGLPTGPEAREGTVRVQPFEHGRLRASGPTVHAELD